MLLAKVSRKVSHLRAGLCDSVSRPMLNRRSHSSQSSLDTRLLTVHASFRLCAFTHSLRIDCDESHTTMRAYRTIGQSIYRITEKIG